MEVGAAFASGLDVLSAWLLVVRITRHRTPTIRFTVMLQSMVSVTIASSTRRIACGG